jgi:hypothetical protein
MPIVPRVCFMPKKSKVTILRAPMFGNDRSLGGAGRCVSRPPESGLIERLPLLLFSARVKCPPSAAHHGLRSHFLKSAR